MDAFALHVDSALFMRVFSSHIVILFTKFITVSFRHAACQDGVQSMIHERSNCFVSCCRICVGLLILRCNQVLKGALQLQKRSQNSTKSTKSIQLVIMREHYLV